MKMPEWEWKIHADSIKKAQAERDALLAGVRELEAKVVEAVSHPRSTNTVFADWILDELRELFDLGDSDEG